MKVLLYAQHQDYDCDWIMLKSFWWVENYFNDGNKWKKLVRHNEKWMDGFEMGKLWI